MLMHIVLLLLQVAAPGRRPGQWGTARSITEVEHCLWLGDLNYRWADSTKPPKSWPHVPWVHHDDHLVASQIPMLQ